MTWISARPRTGFDDGEAAERAAPPSTLAMQYRIPLASPCNLDAIGDALQDADPAALVDLDAQDGALRVSTTLDPVDIVPLLDAAGVSVSTQQVVRLPSECCGGCGG